MVTQIKKKILFQTCYKCKCNFVPIFFIFLFPQSFEALSERAVAVVVDPIQSVKGKVRVFRFTLWKTVQTLVKKKFRLGSFLGQFILVTL